MAQALPPRGLMRIQWRIHRLAWQISGGRMGRKVGGMPVLKLMTTGHRTGEQRPVLLWHVMTPLGPVMTGTNAGADYDPAWVKNLRSDNSATMMLDGATKAVAGVFLEGSEYDEAWAALVAANRAYEEYSKHMTRPHSHRPTGGSVRIHPLGTRKASDSSRSLPLIQEKWPTIIRA